jgi:hypothetical protein
VAHRDAVVDRDRVELARDPARLLDRRRDDLADRLQVGVAGDELGEGVGDRDDRLAEVLALDAGGAEQRRAPAMLRPWVTVRDLSSGIGDSYGLRRSAQKRYWRRTAVVLSPRCGCAVDPSHL